MSKALEERGSNEIIKRDEAFEAIQKELEKVEAGNGHLKQEAVDLR